MEKHYLKRNNTSRSTFKEKDTPYRYLHAWINYPISNICAWRKRCKITFISYKRDDIKKRRNIYVGIDDEKRALKKKTWINQRENVYENYLLELSSNRDDSFLLFLHSFLKSSEEEWCNFFASVGEFSIICFS